MKKPNIDDYGIKEEDFKQYSKYKTELEKINKISIWESCVLFVMLMTFSTIAVYFITKFFINLMFDIVIQYNNFPLKYTEVIAFVLVSYPICSGYRKSKIKNVEHLISGFTSKYISKLEQYYIAINQYKEKVEEEEIENNNINEYVLTIRAIDFKTLKTEDLKEYVLDLYYNNIDIQDILPAEYLNQERKSEVVKNIVKNNLSIFDWYLIEEKINIVCFGIDDNISKIEIQQFIEFICDNEETIYIYTVNQISNKELLECTKIKIIYADKLKQLLINKFSKNIQ